MQDNIRLGALVTFSLVFLLCQVVEATSDINNRPVIGIVAQKPYPDYKQHGNQYVLGDYFNYLEMAGASVVVIKGKQPKEYYTEVFNRINGVLLPGGNQDLITSPFARTSRILYALAIEANDKGDYFPIWGTCQGFQSLVVDTAKRNLLQQSDSENMSVPLTLLPAYNKSRLLGNASHEIIHYLSHENITANFHHLCLATETYNQEPSLNKFYRAISVNRGRQGKDFVSTLEGFTPESLKFNEIIAFHYPFYGTQWHPEKNIFTRNVKEDVLHSFHGVEVSQYMANFFVNEARKNFHKYPSEEERSRAVIENDPRVFIPEGYFEGYFYNVTEEESVA